MVTVCNCVSYARANDLCCEVQFHLLFSESMWIFRNLLPNRSPSRCCSMAMLTTYFHLYCRETAQIIVIIAVDVNSVSDCECSRRCVCGSVFGSVSRSVCWFSLRHGLWLRFQLSLRLRFRLSLWLHFRFGIRLRVRVRLRVWSGVRPGFRTTDRMFRTDLGPRTRR